MCIKGGEEEEEGQKMRHVNNFMEQSTLWMLTNPQPVSIL